MLTFFAILQAVGFKFVGLTERRLLESGVSPFAVLSLYRWALIPALIWSAFFITPSVLQHVIVTPYALSYLLFIAVAWNTQAYLSCMLARETYSAGLLSAIQIVMYLPTLLLVGTWFNNQSPSILSIISAVTISTALLIKPTPHKKISENNNNGTVWPLFIVVLVAFIRTSVDSLNSGATKEALKLMAPEVMLSLFVILTLTLTSIIFMLKKRNDHDIKRLKTNKNLAVWIPLVWFLASIPETFGFAGLAIYTLVSIGSITFIMDIISDLKNQRISWSARTMIFICMTISGMAAACLTV